MIVNIAPEILAFLLVIFLARRYGAGKGYLFALACTLWLPYIDPYPLGSIGRLVKVEDLGLIEVMIVIPCLGLLPRVKGRVAALGNGRWLALYVIGGLIALAVAALVEPLSGFRIESGASFFRQACLMSLALYVGVRRLIGDNATAEKSVIWLMIGALIFVVVMLFSHRSGVSHAAAEDMIGRYSLPFGIVFSVGGNSGAVYFFMMCLLGASLYLNGSSRSKRMIGLACWGATFLVSMRLGTRAVWIMAVPLHVLMGVLSMAYCHVPWKRVTIALALPVAALVALYSLDLVRSEYITSQIDSLQYRSDSLRDIQTFEYRIDQYYVLGPIVAANPLGVGYLDVFPLEIRQPHSLILKLALTTGVLGLTAYFAFLGVAVLRCMTAIGRVEVRYRWMLVGGVTIITFLVVLSPGYDLLGRFNFHASFIFVCAVMGSVVDRQLAVRRSQGVKSVYRVKLR